MKNSNAILEIMTGDHALINVLLINFKDSIGKDVDLVEKEFDKFRWELEKHIFVEEKVIFIPCKQLDSKICKTIQNLVKQHDIMLEMLNEVKNDLVTKNETDVSKFQEIFMQHIKTEEEVLYPALDQQLAFAQKETIIAQINEIPIKKE